MPEIELKPVPPREAIAFFRGKGFRASFNWTEVWQDEHAGAFTVAKATRLDVLQEIHAELDRALADGRTFQQFQRDLTPRLQAKGWWGRQSATDPITGEAVTVQLGSKRRLRTIYDANIRAANAAGRWERIQRLKRRRPYLMYSAVLDSRTRPQHRAWHGTVLPVDHPWWETHYPPNGWHCRCIVRQLADRDLAREGLSVSSPPPIIYRSYVNRRTGRTASVPNGVDPGWGSNVGKAHLALDREKLARSIETSPPSVARAGIQDGLADPAFRAFAAGTVPGRWAVAQAPGQLAAVVGARVQSVFLSDETARAKAARHGLAAADYAVAQELLDRGTVLQESDRNLVLFGKSGGKLWRLVVKATGDGRELYLTTLHESRPRQRLRLERRLRVLRP